MQLSFIPKRYSELLTRDGLDAMPRGYIQNILSELQIDDQKLIIKETNYGSGHDWIWILLVFQGIGNIIVLGDKIDKGFQGWSNIGKRIKRFIKKVDQVKLDIDALKALCLYEISKKNRNLSSLQLLSETEVEASNNSSMFPGRKFSDFVSKNKNYYVFIFKVNGSVIYIFFVR
jgi:hypothetical protein